MMGHSIKNKTKVQFGKECGRGFEATRTMFGPIKIHSQRVKMVPSVVESDPSHCHAFEPEEADGARYLVMLSKGVDNLLKFDSSAEDSAYFEGVVSSGGSNCAAAVADLCHKIHIASREFEGVVLNVVEEVGRASCFRLQLTQANFIAKESTSIEENKSETPSQIIIKVVSLQAKTRVAVKSYGAALYKRLVLLQFRVSKREITKLTRHIMSQRDGSNFGGEINWPVAIRQATMEQATTLCAILCTCHNTLLAVVHHFAEFGDNQSIAKPIALPPLRIAPAKQAALLISTPTYAQPLGSPPSKHASCLEEPVLKTDLDGLHIGHPISRQTLIFVNGLPQWFVYWFSEPDAHSSWEPVDILMQHFPNLRLEDKAISNGGGVDRELSVHSGNTESRAVQREGINPYSCSCCSSRGPTAARMPSRAQHGKRRQQPENRIPPNPKISSPDISPIKLKRFGVSNKDHASFSPIF